MNACIIASENCLDFSVYGENIIYGHKMYSIKIWLVGHFFYKLRICSKLLLSIFQNNPTWRVLFKKTSRGDVERQERRGRDLLQTRRAIFKKVVQHSEQWYLHGKTQSQYLTRIYILGFCF